MRPGPARLLPLRLWQRWGLLTSGLVLLALLAMGYTQERAFTRGLLAHANELERARLPDVARRLAGEYQAAQGWQRLQNDPGRWLALIFGAERAPPPHARPGRPPGPPPPRPGHRPGPHPPRPDADGPHALSDRPPRLSYAHRLTLLDPAGTRLWGPPVPPDAYREPVRSGDRLIAELALTPLPELSHAADLEFAARQRRTAWWIGAAVILASFMAAFVLSWRISARIARLAQASRRLAAGEQAARAGDLGHDEIGALARDFDQMAERLQQNRTARDRWMADISHDLRTPLTILRGDLAALEDGIRPLDRAALGALVKAADRLAERIEDLQALAVSDVGGLSYRFVPTDLVSVLQEALDAHHDRIRALPLSLDVQLPARLDIPRGDDRRLRQMLDNLLDNSLRHTDPGGQLRIQARLLPDAGAELCIEDSAPGVPPESLPRLQERHYRAAPERTTGSGLGLTIVRNIVEAHGASLAIEPSPLGGLRVTITFPRDPRST